MADWLSYYGMQWLAFNRKAGFATRCEAGLAFFEHIVRGVGALNALDHAHLYARVFYL